MASEDSEVEDLLRKIDANPIESKKSILDAIEILRNAPGSSGMHDYCLIRYINFCVGTVQKLREQYQSLFLPNSSFWLEWLSDVSELKKPDVVVKSLFLLALENCPHYSIALRYISYVTESYDNEEMVCDNLS